MAIPSSLSTPALFSPPAAHFIARTLYRGIHNRNLPNLMSLAVTDGCNARCGHGSFYEGAEDPGRPLLRLAEIRRLIHDAQELGVSILNLVGGEPLLRPDLAAIIASVDKSLSTVVLFTEGWHLAAQGLLTPSPAAASAERGNAYPSYPGVVFSAWISSHRSVGCACGTSYPHLSPYGDVMSCDFNHAIFGNVREEPLWRLWERLSTHPYFASAAPLRADRPPWRRARPDWGP
jgi:MoaA/NifB/PqqE/SkfB family radical SAM enzyme